MVGQNSIYKIIINSRFFLFDNLQSLKHDSSFISFAIMFQKHKKKHFKKIKKEEIMYLHLGQKEGLSYQLPTFSN